MNNLAFKLTELRKHYNFSQSYLAEVLDCDVLEYIAYENGSKVMKYADLVKISNFYHINVEELFKNSSSLTLYEVSKEDTDEINLEYFIPKKKNKFLDLITSKRFLVAVIGVLLISIVSIVVINPFKNRREYVVSKNNKNRLAVSETSVVYIDNYGGVKGSGDNSNSQLSNLPSSGSIKVAEGATFTVILKEDGTLISRGLMDKFADEISGWKNIIDVACGDGHIIAVDNEGDVLCTGDNTYGQCEIENKTDIKNVYATHRGSILVGNDNKLHGAGEFIGSSKIKNYENIIDIASSEDTLVLLNSNGHIEYESKSLSFNTAGTWNNIKAVACGNDFIAGLDEDGYVHIDINNYLIEETVNSWKDIIAIKAADEYLIAFDGQKIYGVGRNNYHQFTTAEEKVTQTLPQVSNIKIKNDEGALTLTFDPVVNASGYSVFLDAGIGQRYKVETNETIVFDTSSLENGKSYNINIVTLGDGENYSDSEGKVVSFTYKGKETVNNQTTNDPIVVEIPFTIDTLIGKTVNNFNAYLSGLGVTNVEGIESDVICEGSEPVVTEVEGIEEGEKITHSELQRRTIKYSYCKVEEDE